MADSWTQASFTFGCSNAEMALLEEAFLAAGNLADDNDPDPPSPELLATFPPGDDDLWSGLRTIFVDPRLGQVRNVNVFNVEERDLAKGDRIQWRLVNHELGLKNADRGTVEKLTGKVATIRWDRDGRVQEVDLDRHRTWDHGYAETVYSAQSKTYARVFVLAPVGSALVNGQNYYTAITRARFGVKLWTEDPKTLAEKLEQNSGEKTSSLEGLGRLDRDGHRAVAQRHPDQLREGRAEQERWREERRERTLMRRLGRRPAPPNGIAEQLAEGAGEVAVRLDRFLQAVLDRERTTNREIAATPTHIAGRESHSPEAAPHPRGPER